MEYDEFKRILSKFSDSLNDIIISKGEFVIQIRGNAIGGSLKHSPDIGVIVQEDGIDFPARKWIIDRLAQIPLLADRIISYTKREESFVTPTGTVLESILLDPKECAIGVEDVTKAVVNEFSKPIVGMTKVVYLTSDAGEGKTTLINEITLRQALRFKNKESDWLILPISLMGRTFLRFDDVFVGALMNVYRFPMLYFDTLVELIRMGVIIPALDGFEEVFVESEGEALSAVGNLMSNLQSSGSVLIASRKAFFEFKTFSSQAKLFDALGTYDADFSHITIDRWKKPQFIDYATKRGIKSPDEFYDSLLEKLHNENHVLLTRAFLVKSLISYVLDRDASINETVAELVNSNKPLFASFVKSIIEREAQIKWIDKSGEPPMPLLSVEQHYDLLSFIAEEMWIQNIDNLSLVMLDGVAEIYSETIRLGTSKSRQVKERIKQHALIVSTGKNSSQYSFDHEEFKNYFLGQAIAKYIIDVNIVNAKSLLQRKQLPEISCDTIVDVLIQRYPDRKVIINSLIVLAEKEMGLTYLKENIGSIVIRIIDDQLNDPLVISNLLFAEDALEGRKLKNIKFNQCIFQATSLKGSTIRDCQFEHCKFETLEVFKNCIFENVGLDNSEVRHIVIGDTGRSLFEPSLIQRELATHGLLLDIAEIETGDVTGKIDEPDEEIVNLEKVFRTFSRATALNDDVIRLKIGNYANTMINEVFPILEKNGILVETTYVGSGSKKRYKLSKQMRDIQDAMSGCGGSFRKFIDILNK
jgi:ribosomal protein L25 (general stress protein Ctc)